MRRATLSHAERPGASKSPNRPQVLQRLLRVTSVSTAILMIFSGLATADQVLSSNLSFQTQDQSMWASGEAFIFNYSQFFGIDSNPAALVINPAAVSGGTPPFSDYSVDPYLQFDTDFKLGMEVGASLNSGSINANLDYQVAMEAPDDIVQGQPFPLTGIATKQGTSSFQSTAPNAEAYVDGVVEAYFGGYARFVTGGTVFGVHDYRMGNGGFTDDPASNSNNPYRTLANINYHPEIIGINRNQSGQLHVLGQNQGGTGSSYTLGPTTITAGNWNVSATGALNGDVVQGDDQKTLVTATLDIDQMALLGKPALGTGFAHDWGVIDIDVGYEILDVKAVLEMGLKQDFSITSAVMVHLQFSENVMIDGIGETNSYLGSLASIPEITLHSNSVTVNPEFIIAAQLNNDTDLTFEESLPITLIEGHMYAAYAVGFPFNVSGTVVNASLGPVYEVNPVSNIHHIDVFSSQFTLGGFDVIQGESFVLSAGIPGDYNHDNTVDAADYVVWRKSDGTPAGYDTWRAHFGQTSGSGSGASLTAAVPEPATSVMLMFAATVWCLRQGRDTWRVSKLINA